MDNRPIGMFDSGAGGLSVFSRLVKLLPDENYIYFADTLNLPYGSKTKEELIEISLKIFDFFKSKNVKAVIMACNTTSALVYDYVKPRYDFKIYPIVQSVSKYIADKNYGSIGVFATEAVINRHAYKNEIQKYNQNVKVYELACPKWVSIVENQLQQEDNSRCNIKMMLDLMLKNHPEKIILGCTHYPYLLDILSKTVSRDMFIDPAEQFARFILDDLKAENMLNKGAASSPVFYTSSNPAQFKSAAKLFYNVRQAEEISLEIWCRA